VSGSVKNSELEALISMLDEPSDPVFDKVREKILGYGIVAVPHLEKAWDNSFDRIIQGRIENILHHIQKANLKRELSNWKQNEKLNLLKGFCLASKYSYPELNIPLIEEKIDKIVKDIWLELNDNLTALEKIKVINHVLFDIHGFKGYKDTKEPTQPLFINTLLESKQGSHLTLGILIIIICQKLEIPVYGVDLPQHFILAYLDEIQEDRFKTPNEKEVLFYINPFNKGAVFTKREIEVFLKHIKLKPSPKFYEPCDNIILIKRLFESIMVTYQHLGQHEKVTELKDIAGVL
jgi:regulator of sirC expression with transglutaminase-like and TPR domain